MIIAEMRTTLSLVGVFWRMVFCAQAYYLRVTKLEARGGPDTAINLVKDLVYGALIPK